MPIKSTNIPVLLFPLKIETRFVDMPSGLELWLRVYPDEAFLQSHNTNLTQEEFEDRKTYRQKIKNGNKSAWSILVNKYGTYRAAFLVQSTDEDIANNDVLEAKKEISFFYKGLPEKFAVYLYPESSYTNNGVKVPETMINAVSHNNYLVAFGDGDRWTSDFDEAIDEGMAFKINLNTIFGENNIPNTFEKIIITGFYYRGGNNNNQTESAKGIEELFENHLFTEGISFLKYGASTNNIGNEKSSYSVRDEYDADANYQHLVKGYELTENTIGHKLAQGLGLEEGKIKHFKNADLKRSEFKHTLQKLTWMALGGHSLQMLFGDQIKKSTYIQLREHYSQFVNAQGWFSPIKIDDQPYGILPVMNISNFKDKESNASISDGVLSNDVPPFAVNLQLILSKLFIQYQSLIKLNPDLIPKLDSDVPDQFEMLEKVLSMQPTSKSFNIVVLSYRKLRSRIPDWLQKRMSITDSLGKMTVGEACQLLAEFTDADLTDEFKQIQARVVEVINVFESFSLDKDQLERMPMYSFSEVEELANQVSANLFILSSEDVTFLEEVFEQVKKDVDNFIRSEAYTLTDTTEVPSTFIQYRGTSSLFSDLLLNSYSQTMALFSEDNTKIPAQMTAFADMALIVLKKLKEVDDTERKELLQETLGEFFDLSSFRLDAWISSLANSRLQALRKETDSAKGIYFGAYGWVEDLKKDTQRTVNAQYKQVDGNDVLVLIDENREEEGGIIHCPTPAQSLAATFFKNSFLTHQDEQDEANPFALNLSSERIQTSEQFMQGIRQDQEIEALLGYKLERYLHEEGFDADIYTLRELFPLEVNIIKKSTQNPDIGFKNLSVINGLSVLEATKTADGLRLLKTKLGLNGYNQILPLIKKLDNIIDGSLDHLFFEAGYQLTQGNLSQSSAAMDAARGDLEPPQTDALKTKIPGVGISHKFIYVFPQPRVGIEIDQCRAYIEPTLDTWLNNQLGEMSKIGCKVQLLEEVERTTADGEVVLEQQIKEEIEVTLDQLGISYLDFLYLSDKEVSDGASELEIRIVKQIGDYDKELTYRITNQVPAGCTALSEAIEVARYAQKLINTSRQPREQDLVTQEKEVSASLDALDNIAQRLETLHSTINAWSTDIGKYKAHLALLNISTAKRIFLNDDNDFDGFKIELLQLLKKVKNELNLFDKDKALESSFQQLFSPLEKAAKLLFGKEFVLLTPVKIGQEIVNSMDKNWQDAMIGHDDINDQWGQARIQTWLQELAQVNRGAAAYEEWQMIQQVWKEKQQVASDEVFKLVQYPTFEKYPWVGLGKSEIDDLLAGAVYEDKIIYQEDDEDLPYPKNGRHYPDGCESMVLLMEKDSELNIDNNYYALVLDEFDEHIPDDKIDTGLSFAYDGPNNEAPQVILLAVASFLATNDWSEDALKDIISDTMDLMKIRMMDTEAIQDYLKKEDTAASLLELLPLVNWTNIPTIN